MMINVWIWFKDGVLVEIVKLNYVDGVVVGDGEWWWIDGEWDNCGFVIWMSII